MLAFDHIVYAAADAENAQKEYSVKRGLLTTKGGSHEEWGTYNYLCYLYNDSYIEWLSISDEEKVSKSDNPLIQQLYQALNQGKSGGIQFALRTTELDSFIDHFQAKGIAYEGPFEGSRKRPDGSILTWRMLFPNSDSTSETLPFLIEWGDEMNKPQNPSFINREKFTTIHLGTTDLTKTVEKLTEIYQIKPTKEFEFPLENGTLIVREGNGARITTETM
ncbi:VOC family protein [Radiobacillus kanasensis]|uniref:VOC family protein n=1 Tax=Radiobacillus kanasensis TaxID=2844358 RepID=UPI001E50159F|nr:VOC family protein [Radiobacillus kanasensis]UFT99804.1 VOC family protein [Radiobacillus kanasensis]